MTHVLRAFREYLRPYRRYVVLLVIGLLIDLAFNAAMPLSFRVLIDDAVPDRDRSLMWTVIAVMVGAVLVAGVAAVGRDYLYAKLGTRVMNDLRLRMFEHLQRLSADYYGRAHVGDIMSRFSTDLAAVNNAVVYALPETVLGLLGFVFYGFLLALLDFRLALIALIGAPLLLLGPRLLGPKAEVESLNVRDTEAAIATDVEENVSSQNVIRAFGLAGRQIAGFQHRLDDMYRRNLRFNILSYMVERTPNVAFLFLQVAVLAVGAVMAVNGDIGIGTLVAFNAILLSLNVSITGLTRIMPLLLIASGGIERIHSLLKELPSVVDPEDPEPLAPLAEGITFDNVVFSYDGSRNQLDGVTFTIPRGTSAAFVGSSGSGKSTVLSLLMRFFDPNGGAVLFDGRDIRGVPQASLREEIGVVPQENLLFDTTIRENIRMGRLDASDDDVEAAARAADVEVLIKQIPGGYDATIGERGGHISGGQRQRIAIARAIVRDPQILVLDEATSALDPATEADIVATIASLATSRTVVAVSHRLASIAGYDRIFVMHEGKLVEQGTHEELVARSGPYADLWAMQSGVQVHPDGRSARVTSEYFRSVPALAGLSDEVLERLSRLFTAETVPEGHVVAREGDSSDGRFYIVARGKATVSRRDAETDEHRFVDVLHDGHHFGAQNLVGEAPHAGTVRTTTPAVLLSVKREDFHGLMDQDARCNDEIGRLLAERRRVGTYNDGLVPDQPPQPASKG